MKKNKVLRNEKIIERALESGTYIANTGATLRATAVVFNCSKSTVHKDVNERLQYISKRTYNKARKQLANNLASRAKRGGLATKKRYEELKDKEII